MIHTATMTTGEKIPPPPPSPHIPPKDRTGLCARRSYYNVYYNNIITPRMTIKILLLLLLNLPARHLSGPVPRKKDSDKHLLHQDPPKPAEDGRRRFKIILIMSVPTTL